jgi:putative addiction module component (TIGR02574 family)
MTTQARELTKQALALKPEERIELAETLLTSVDGFASPEIEAAWREEIERRVNDFEEGRTQGVPAEQVFAKVRALLDEIHKVPPAR